MKSLNKDRANCFNAIQIYFGDTIDKIYLEPEEFVSYIKVNFKQISLDMPQQLGDVSIVWNRSSNELPWGSIKIEELEKSRKGYPFGLIIEHAFVFDGLNLVFQKRGPTPEDPYETISESNALQPYLSLSGFEVTRHRRVKLSK